MSTPNRSRRLAIAAAAILTTAGLALTGCSSSGTAASSDSASTLIAYTGQSGDYQINYNPWSPSNIGGVGTIYESLFFITNVNTKDPKPLLGKSYEWNTDGTQLRITLRDGATWSDGKPFTAKDVVFTLDMLKKYKALNSIGYDGTAKPRATPPSSCRSTSRRSCSARTCSARPGSCRSTSGRTSTRPPTSCASPSGPARTRSAPSRRRRSPSRRTRTTGAAPRP